MGRTSVIARIGTLFLTGQSLATWRNLYLEDISTVDPVETAQEEEGVAGGSFEDFCCGIVLLEKLVKPI